MSNSNLPPGCTDDDIERNANGECPVCATILDGGECPKCGWSEDEPGGRDREAEKGDAMRDEHIFRGQRKKSRNL